MKKVILAFLIALLAITSSLAQGRVFNAVKASEVRGGCETCILPSKFTPVPKPPADQPFCCLTIINNTGYYAEIYLDGTYQGTVGPWSQSEACTTEGWEKIFIRTPNDEYVWTGDFVECNEPITLGGLPY